ncbi:MAG: hypothetical protein AAFX00_13410, partial [Pseudomonadota bacterium]
MHRDAPAQNPDEIGAMSVVPESFGYSVRPGQALQRRAHMVEWAAYLLAFMLFFGTIGAVLSFPVTANGVDPF